MKNKKPCDLLLIEGGRAQIFERWKMALLTGDDKLCETLGRQMARKGRLFTVDDTSSSAVTHHEKNKC